MSNRVIRFYPFATHKLEEQLLSINSVWVAFMVHILAQYENSYWTGFWNYLASGMLEIRIVSSLEMMNGVYDIFA